MRFFFDNNLSPHLAKALDILESNGNGVVVHLKEIFQENVEDRVWLEHIGKEKMILITKDRKIYRRHSELIVLKNFGVGAFFIIGKNLDIWAQIKLLINHWLEIKHLANSTKRPFAFKVRSRGKIEPLPL